MERLRVAGHRARDLGARLPVAAAHVGGSMKPHLGRQGVPFDDRVDAMTRVSGVEIDVEEAQRPAQRPVEDLLDASRRVLLAEKATAGVALHLLDRERRGVLWLVEGAWLLVPRPRLSNRKLQSAGVH